MPRRKKDLLINRIKTLAQSRSGADLIEWVEEIVTTYADVRNVHADIAFETRRDAVKIIENELLKPLKGFARLGSDFPVSGNEAE